MPLITFFAIYPIIWAIVMQALLPLGIKSQAEAGDIVQGTEPGAPVRPLWLRKALAATLIALALWGVFYWILVKTGLGIRG